MQKAIGAVCLGVGMLLVALGCNLSKHLASQIKEAFTASLTDRAIYFYIGGAVLSVIGSFRIFVARK